MENTSWWLNREIRLLREELNIIREAMMNRAIELLREKFRREPRECLNIILGLQKNAKTERDLAAKNKEGFLVRQGEYVLRLVCRYMYM